MMIQAIEVPEIGENVASGVVVAVHVKVGDRVAVDDTVIELETDKALVEIPSPFNGRITEVLAEPGAQMKVGEIIARVETDAQAGVQPTDDRATVAGSAGTGPDRVSSAAPAPETLRPISPADEARPQSVEPVGIRGQEPAPAAASPSIRRLARELGVDIHAVSGSGAGGRISEADIKSHVRRQLPDPSPRSSMPDRRQPPPPDASRWGAVDIEEMDTVRRLTAQSTAASWMTIPHVTQFDEADISHCIEFIENTNAKKTKTGYRLTLTAVLTWLCARGLKRFPRFNASIDVAANRITLKRYINIGIATETPRGLLVPVVRDADRQSIVETAAIIGDLADRARNKKIRSDEMEGGTFTISNQGGIGGTGFTPLVLWPQVAILGVSRSAVKPVYVKDRFEPRTLLPLSLSYDHRNIDGADAARFLRWICDGLEQPLVAFLD